MMGANFNISIWNDRHIGDVFTNNKSKPELKEEKKLSSVLQQREENSRFSYFSSFKHLVNVRRVSEIKGML